MSNAVFPIVKGLAWIGGKTPVWNTLTMRSVSGLETRLDLQAYPLWQFTLGYEYLLDGPLGNGLSTLLGFYLARQGSFDSFLYSDPSDNAVTAQSFGTGNGSTTGFQLVRAYGGFAEPAQNINGTPSIYDNGTLKTAGTDYTIDGNGFVTFAVAPASGHALTWTGSFYYRCRFVADTISPNNFMKNLWELKKIEFVGAPGNRV